uniref:B box-type domain-containing protein n=1 Tax=Cyprinodon variegatus TaxID=28743 RepID=A0A3Q2DQ52_CYPVA
SSGLYSVQPEHSVPDHCLSFCQSFCSVFIWFMSWILAASGKRVLVFVSSPDRPLFLPCGVLWVFEEPAETLVSSAVQIFHLQMAERALKSYLSCHVCSETFRDPMSLSCYHNFCSINVALKQLAESFAVNEKSGSSATEQGVKQLMVVCRKHQEDPKLFCKDEQRAVCPVCEFSLHQSHKVVPIEQAVSELKEQLKSDLKSLQDKRNKHKQVEKTYNEVIQHSKKQLLSTERQIRAEFNKLHQFLREEEESRLAALREEEVQKGKTIVREMKRIEEQISSLSDSISAVEEDLQKDQLSFLTVLKEISFCLHLCIQNDKITPISRIFQLYLHSQLTHRPIKANSMWNVSCKLN